MTYIRITAYPFSSLHLPRKHIVNATRRLYAQSETNLKRETGERNQVWLGVLICLASGVLEVGVLRWFLD